MKKPFKYIFIFLSFFCYHNFLCAQTWHAIGHGVGSSSSYYINVFCLKTINDNLLVGGDFKKEYGASGDGIARFDGLKWDSLGCSYGIGPLSFDIYSDNNIYVGGGFGSICDNLTYSDIARWDGSLWDNVNNTGPNGTVNSVASYNNELYIGGFFSSVNSLNVKRIARWDGATWHDVGGGVWGPLPYEVKAMTIYKGELIVAGWFLKAGNDTVNHIAAWDGNQWHSLGSGVNDLVWTLYTDTIDDLLYAGGNFTYADDTIPVKYIAYWDGQKWSAMKDSANSFHGLPGVFAITRFDSKIYVGGTNITADTVLVRWDGTNWENISGLNGYIRALTEYKGNLYVGGGFTSINGDTSINHIACYGDSCPLNVGIHEILQEKINYLWQNIPNPFDNSTSIPYFVPNGSKGFLRITDTKGELVDEYALSQGKNSLTISLKSLKSGTYFYTIIIDGITKGTKKMVLK